MIKYNIHISNWFCNHLKDKYDIETFKTLETKAFCRVLISQMNSVFTFIMFIQFKEHFVIIFILQRWRSSSQSKCYTLSLILFAQVHIKNFVCVNHKALYEFLMNKSFLIYITGQLSYICFKSSTRYDYKSNKLKMLFICLLHRTAIP